MTSAELRKLNAYPEWRDNHKIIALTDYVESLQNKDNDNDLYESFKKDSV